jgi:hypothetical protein
MGVMRLDVVSKSKIMLAGGLASLWFFIVIIIAATGAYL